MPDEPLQSERSVDGATRTQGSPHTDEKRTTLGPYRLFEKVGEGGMGEVWVAEQTAPLRRKVAIKIIKRGMDTAQVLARFEAERQALAIMDHPAIAKVFDTGETPGGRAYFVMEYVHGVSITEHCDRNRLPTRERLKLFSLVCEGVQHAHHKAVIHRDLKPSNVLVAIQDGKPVPKIIDFGVAKATAQRLTERTMYTELGVMIGTPEYMSPEQAEMTGQNVDTRTDVYSLGVILYELLVGALPFEPRDLRRSSLEEIRRKIREQDPERPSTRIISLGEASTDSAGKRATDPGRLTSQLRGDLDWITMKALEKDPGRRYGSPSELAADIARHLGHEPVLARRPSTWYRARKFVRRHRLGVAAATLAALVLSAFGVTMAVQARRIARARDRTDREARMANRALEFLTKQFEILDPSEARGNTITAREVLDRASKRLESELADEPAVQARLMLTIGKVYLGLGLYGPAAAQLERSLTLRRKLLGDDHPDTLASIAGMGALYFIENKYKEADPYVREALERRRRVLGNEHPDTLESINAMASQLFWGQYEIEDALPYAREALQGRRRVLGNDHSDTLESIDLMGCILMAQNKLEEAEAYGREALEGRRRVLGNDHPSTLESIFNMGRLLNAQGKPKEGEQYFRETMEGFRRVYGDDHPTTITSISNMGYLLQNRGKEAEPYLREALERSRRVHGSDDPFTLNTMVLLGKVYTREGRIKDAEPLLEEAVATARRALPIGDRSTGEALNNYGRCLTCARRYVEAEAALLEGHKILSAISAELAHEAAANLAALYEAWSKPDKAAAWRATPASD